MKILWVCNVMLPKIAKSLNIDSFNGGGWLVGLSDDLLQNNVDLTICFPVNKQDEIIFGQVDSLKYYSFYESSAETFKYSKNVEDELYKIINEVKPDVVHIFGTEFPHTLATVNACERLNILNKVIINIQGLASVCSRHYYADLPYKIVNRFSFRDLLKLDNIRKQKNKFTKRGNYEIKAIKKINHVIGRTDWDKACTEQINPNATYHFCNETLRDEFYKYKWSLSNCEKYSIFVSQSQYPLKGFHYLLEAMPEIKKRYPDVRIYTTSKSPFNLKAIDKIKQTYYNIYIGKIIKKYDLQNNVIFLGQLSEKEMCKRFIKSHVFVSASIIENESNSISEAKLLGVPVIASFVGGVTNRIDHNKDGFLYQHNAPYMLAYYICKIFDNDNLALNFSEKSKEHAKIINNRINNTRKILDVYKEVGGIN